MQIPALAVVEKAWGLWRRVGWREGTGHEDMRVQPFHLLKEEKIRWLDGLTRLSCYVYVCAGQPPVHSRGVEPTQPLPGDHSIFKLF